MSKFNKIVEDIQTEYIKAVSKHGSFNSAHEGFAVLNEEIDELWDEVKKRDKSKANMRKEAVQVAAMAVRFIHDVCDKED